MPILLQINKITFKKGENFEKIQNLPEIVTEIFFFFNFLSWWFFLNCPGGNSI